MASRVGALLPEAALSPSGRPLLRADEVECQLIEGVGVELDPEDEAANLRSGVLSLTTHRFIWIGNDGQGGRRLAYELPFAAALAVQPQRRNLAKFFASSRLACSFWTGVDGRLSRSVSVPFIKSLKAGWLALLSAADSFVSYENPTIPMSASVTRGCRSQGKPRDRPPSEASVSFVFRGPVHPDPFMQRVAEVVQARAWASAAGAEAAIDDRAASGATASTAPATTSHKFNPAMAGVSGILLKEQRERETTDRNLHEAFSDLSALMVKAKDMVQLADRMQAKLARQTTSEGGGGEDDDFGGSRQDVQDWLLSVGIASPVTRESAGALYHQQLSRQLADFVSEPLAKAGGMVALVDVYCMFNRARGTELISPEDLVQACTIWRSIDMPLRLRKFDSGVMVIQSKDRTDEEVLARISDLASQPAVLETGINASEAAFALNMAPALAKEELLLAESCGILCRDDGADGLRFYQNFFKTAEMPAASP
eukprot:SM000157S02069  [mRNA]  locus=s157:144056:146758:+ [translate_table: standard]